MEFSDDDSTFPARSSQSKASVLTSLTLFLRKVESSAHFTYAINVYNAVCTRCTIQGALYCWHLVDINSHIKSGSLSSITIALEKERRKERPCWTAALKGQFFFLYHYKYYYYNLNTVTSNTEMRIFLNCPSLIIVTLMFCVSLSFPQPIHLQLIQSVWKCVSCEDYKTVWYLYICWKSNLFT